MSVAVPSVMSYLNEADNAKYMTQARAYLTVFQAEQTKAIADADEDLPIAAAWTNFNVNTATLSQWKKEYGFVNKVMVTANDAASSNELKAENVRFYTSTTTFDLKTMLRSPGKKGQTGYVSAVDALKGVKLIWIQYKDKKKFAIITINGSIKVYDKDPIIVKTN